MIGPASTVDAADVFIGVRGITSHATRYRFDHGGRARHIRCAFDVEVPAALSLTVLRPPTPDDDMHLRDGFGISADRCSGEDHPRRRVHVGRGRGRTVDLAGFVVRGRERWADGAGIVDVDQGEEMEVPWPRPTT